jgi:uncharacterized membrane protein
VSDGARDGTTHAEISAILRAGVTASLALIALGTVLSFARGAGYGASHADVARLVGPAGAFPRSARWLWSGLRRLDGQAVIVAGVIFLIATPVLRVAVSIASYARERDTPFVFITSIVLALLLLSFALGLAA